MFLDLFTDIYTFTFQLFTCKKITTKNEKTSNKNIKLTCMKRSKQEIYKEYKKEMKPTFKWIYKYIIQSIYNYLIYVKY